MKTKTNSPKTTLVAVWMPKELVDALDRVAQREDSDRSKIIRRKLRETLRITTD
jgi:metal-responsive CopG/Arc/MetJ family transcriptional regulator